MPLNLTETISTLLITHRGNFLDAKDVDVIVIEKDNLSNSDDIVAHIGDDNVAGKYSVANVYSSEWQHPRRQYRILEAPHCALLPIKRVSKKHLLDWKYVVRFAQQIIDKLMKQKNRNAGIDGSAFVLRL